MLINDNHAPLKRQRQRRWPQWRGQWLCCPAAAEAAELAGSLPPEAAELAGSPPSPLDELDGVPPPATRKPNHWAMLSK